MNILFCVLIGYILGSINPSYIIGRIKGFDIRRRGSGNAGASNALIVMGKWVAIVSAVFDIAKAYFSYRFCQQFLPFVIAENNVSGAVAGSACIVGHILPVFMKFKGGKGLACLGGVILAFNTKVFLAILAVELIIVLIVDYICIVPTTAVIIFPVIYGAVTTRWISAAIFFIPAVLIILRHIENFKRIRNGSEAHVSFLWKRNEEIARITGKSAEEAEEDDRKG